MKNKDTMPHFHFILYARCFPPCSLIQVFSANRMRQLKLECCVQFSLSGSLDVWFILPGWPFINARKTIAVPHNCRSKPRMQMARTRGLSLCLFICTDQVWGCLRCTLKQPWWHDLLPFMFSFSTATFYFPSFFFSFTSLIHSQINSLSLFIPFPLATMVLILHPYSVFMIGLP